MNNEYTLYAPHRPSLSNGHRTDLPATEHSEEELLDEISLAGMRREGLTEALEEGHSTQYTPQVGGREGCMHVDIQYVAIVFFKADVFNPVHIVLCIVMFPRASSYTYVRYVKIVPWLRNS